MAWLELFGGVHTAQRGSVHILQVSVSVSVPVSGIMNERIEFLRNRSEASSLSYNSHSHSVHVS